MEQWIVILLFVISIIASSSKPKKGAAEAKESQEVPDLEATFEEILKKATENSAPKKVKQPVNSPTPTTYVPTTSPKEVYRPMQTAPEGRDYGKPNLSPSKPNKRNTSPRPKKITPKSQPVQAQVVAEEEVSQEVIDARNLIIYDAILNPKHTEY